MTNLKRALYALAFLLLGFAGGWTAQGRFGRQHRHGGFGLFGPHESREEHAPGELPRPMTHMMEDLGVSPEQAATIRTAFLKHEENRTRQHTALEAARKEFEADLASSADKAVLTPKFQKLLDAKRDADAEHFEMMMEVRSVLTPDQRLRMTHLKGSPPGGPREP